MPSRIEPNMTRAPTEMELRVARAIETACPPIVSFSALYPIDEIARAAIHAVLEAALNPPKPDVVVTVDMFEAAIRSMRIALGTLADGEFVPVAAMHGAIIPAYRAMRALEPKASVLSIHTPLGRLYQRNGGGAYLDERKGEWHILACQPSRSGTDRRAP